MGQAAFTMRAHPPDTFNLPALASSKLFDPRTLSLTPVIGVEALPVPHRRDASCAVTTF